MRFNFVSPRHHHDCTRLWLTFRTWDLLKLSSSSAVALKSCLAMASIAVCGKSYYNALPTGTARDLKLGLHYVSAGNDTGVQNRHKTYTQKHTTRQRTARHSILGAFSSPPLDKHPFQQSLVVSVSVHSQLRQRR